ncbi:MAG: hypothetical protein QXK94_05705 [Candidatus Jordarchaeales archaeon]
MPFRRRNLERRKEGGELELGLVREKLDAIAGMIVKYTGEVERRLEVLEKVLFGFERRVAEIEGRVSLLEKRIEEHIAEGKVIKVPSFLVEEAKAQPPSVVIGGKEEEKMATVSSKAKQAVEEFDDLRKGWEVAGEKEGFTSVIEEFKKLLDDEAD